MITRVAIEIRWNTNADFVGLENDGNDENAFLLLLSFDDGTIIIYHLNYLDRDPAKSSFN